MIIYKSGNILDDDAEWIVCPVNTQGVMGAGLAKQFKQKYPEYFKHYKEMCIDNGYSYCIGPGDVVFHSKGRWGTKEYGWNVERNIISFATKNHWKDKSKLSWIKDGLDAILDEYYYVNNDPELADIKTLNSVALPKLGCGLGGLSWELEVKPLMEEFAVKLPEIEVRVYV